MPLAELFSGEIEIFLEGGMSAVYEDEYEPLGYEQGTVNAKRLQRALRKERSEELEIQIEQDEQKKPPQTDAHPAEKKLKREIQQEALARLEDAARTEDDFRFIIQWWDKLDANRERRERYHEVSRSGYDLPLDYGAARDGLYFPDTLNSALDKQMLKGDFLDTIFNCPYEVDELVTDRCLSQVLRELSDDHKEILFLHAVRMYSSKRIGQIREQSDRNIRKVRITMFKKIYKKLFPLLLEKLEKGLPMTKEEILFVENMKNAVLDRSKDG